MARKTRKKYELHDICQPQRGGELWCEARLYRHVRVPCAWSLAWLEATDPWRGAYTRTLLLRLLPASLELTIISTFFAAVMLRCLHTRVHVQYCRHFVTEIFIYLHTISVTGISVPLLTHPLIFCCCRGC